MKQTPSRLKKSWKTLSLLGVVRRRVKADVQLRTNQEPLDTQNLHV